MVKRLEPDLNSVFSALADPTRRAILEKLAGGPSSVSALAEPFSISLPAISRHLSILIDAGLIEAQKVGRRRWMSLRPHRLKDAAAWLDRYQKFWSQRLDALDRLLTSGERSRK